jgi:two-component system, NtrC family, sensor histidine kinase HydH
MKTDDVASKDGLQNKLKWLMFLRLVFTVFLFVSTVLLHFKFSNIPTDKPLRYLYILVATVFGLSFFYAIALRAIKRLTLFAFIQTSIDTVIVTLIIYLTGGFYSVFSFLYLVVIIYGCMLLYRPGGMLIATISTLLYALLIFLEFQSILNPFIAERSAAMIKFNWSSGLYKVIFTSLACYAVAFLSGFLTEQNRKSKDELKSMAEHVRRVEKMAAMGEMAAGLAHEIKNPLASLAGSIQLLREEIDYNPDHDRLMHIVLRETERLSALVNKFLFFARPPSGKTETILLDAALAEIIALFGKDRSIFGKVAITQKLLPNIWVRFDPIHLRQVVWNLLLNAAESIPEKGNIVVKMTQNRPNSVKLSISDDGCGMSKEVLKSIFDPFFTTKSTGTGLGLSIVHRILEIYNSRLEVESEVGKGSDFILTLECSAPNPTPFEPVI